MTKKRGKKKSHSILVLILVLAILGGCGYAYYYFFMDKNNDTAPKPKEEPNNTPKDEEAPIIVASNIVITEGDKLDLLKGVSATDNVTENLEVTVSGDYDANKPGTYTITYSATDEEGNIGTKEITLIVNKKPEVVVDPAPKKEEQTRKDFVTSKGFSGYTENGVTYIDGVLVVNKTYSVPSSYGNGLTKTTKNAFNEMKTAAAADGISLKIVSGFRSYKTQKNLYNNYVKRDGKTKADTYSARAGHSEHQTGLAMDINRAGSAFNGTPEAKWLSNNAYKFGFILRYPEGKTNETGYKFESWHYRYVGEELATKLYNDGDWITLEDYFGITSQYAE